ncbi:TPA_asm: hypothetical protein vir335_00041 [Classicovirus victor]|uniref:Uncharacterized protein n=1 Tax=Caudoviricetes sp. vir335 TaxID=3068357 RepID=A0AA86XS59_9CAUD|nr:TPA_asm: hypothetical protein vir335_00041 [Caudoviricetes sp. vir335]
MALLFAYGLHLRQGGSIDSFMELNYSDIQILISTEMGLRRYSAGLEADAVLSRLFARDD